MPPVMLCDVRMAKPRLAKLPSAVLNSVAACVASRHAGNWLAIKSKNGVWHSAEIGDLGGPVIHLDVDVRVVITVPRRLLLSFHKPCKFAGRPPGREQEIIR